MERARLNAKKRITLEADRLSLMVLVQSVRFLWFLTSFTRPPFPYPVPYPRHLPLRAAEGRVTGVERGERVKEANTVSRDE